MDSQLAEKIKRYPEEIKSIQTSLQDILDKISVWTKKGDYTQLALLMPRLKYMLSRTDILRADMESASVLLKSDDNNTSSLVIKQQLLALKNIEGQIKSLSGSVGACVKAIEISERELLAADIISRIGELEEAIRELK